MPNFGNLLTDVSEGDWGGVFGDIFGPEETAVVPPAATGSSAPAGGVIGPASGNTSTANSAGINVGAVTLAGAGAGALVGGFTRAALRWIARYSPQILMIVRLFGIEGLAQALGTTTEIATKVFGRAALKRRRRRRGISAADIRRTRRTLRTVCNLTHQLAMIKSRKKVC